MAACLSIHAVAIVVGITLVPYARHYMSAEVPKRAVYSLPCSSPLAAFRMGPEHRGLELAAEAMRGATSSDSG